MNDHIKKGTILSLSLLLTSTFSVSTAIPAMTAFYADRSINQVEQLMSLPALAIMLIIMLHPILIRIISRNISILMGLMLLALSGIMPLFSQDYTYIFISRMIHGVGIGLVNVYAVTIINEMFDGNERSAMLGYRGAAEILGNIICTFIVGQILSLGADWKYCFLIYVAALPILLLYLRFIKKGGKDLSPDVRQEAFARAAARSTGVLLDAKAADYQSDAKAADYPADVEPAYPPAANTSSANATAAVPDEGPTCKGHDANGSQQDHGSYIRDLIFYGICGAIIVGISCCNTVRIPSLVIEKGLGAEAEASLISSARLLAGFLSGISFWRFEQLLGKRLQPVFFIAMGFGELIMAFSSNIFILLAGALIAGSALSILTTSVFQRATEHFPAKLSDKATTVILVGCNLGSGLASYVLYLIDQLNGRMYMSFLVFGVVFLPLGILLMLKKMRNV